LARFGWVNQRAGMTRVYVSERDGLVAAFYGLSTGGVEPLAVPARVLHGVARHEIPVILLTRLAVDTLWQGQGLGRAMLRDALLRVAAISEEVRVRALLIHAADDAAREFCLRCAEFEASPTDPLHLFLLIKDLRRTLAGQG
jgi:GNAT superfamily N-acetyltransferase